MYRAAALAFLVATAATVPRLVADESGRTGLVAGESARKCPNAPIMFPDAPDYLTILDGRVIDSAAAANIDLMGDRIESVEVACAEPVYRRFSVKTRRGGIVVFSKPGPVTILRAQVDSVARLYRGRLDTGGSPTDAAALGWRDTTGLMKMEIGRSPTGEWVVTGRHRWIDEPVKATIPAR